MRFLQRAPLVLASGSPRRREYFERYGFDFLVEKADIPEIPQEGESPLAFATRLAREKGEAVARQRGDEKEAILSADTIVVLDGEIIGKPESRADALNMLTKLNGRTHEVITAYAIAHGGRITTRDCTTKVGFFQTDPKLLKAYSKTTDPMDKAGSYSIQGPGSFLVRFIEGSYNNVVGLPIELVIQDLINLGIIAPMEES